MSELVDRHGFAVPTIPASAGALIWDRKGRLLILDPSYKQGWTIPGGQIGWFLALGIVGGLVAALWPAFTASRLDVLRAIASE